MKKLYTCRIAAVTVFLGVFLGVAQAQQTPPSQQPSTSEAEGTAADRTQPGRTPTQGAPQAQDQAQNPQPSTSEAEGTAADRTPPGKTPTGQRSEIGSEIVGAEVVTAADAPLGKVVDVVFDSKNQPTFVVISSEGKAVAVPYSVANSMMTADKIVMDQSRLKAAPKIKEGEWRSQSSSTWKNESARYWDRRG